MRRGRRTLHPNARADFRYFAANSAASPPPRCRLGKLRALERNALADACPTRPWGQGRLHRERSFSFFFLFRLSRVCRGAVRLMAAIENENDKEEGIMVIHAYPSRPLGFNSPYFQGINLAVNVRR